jgi:hypothetical protein
MAEFMIQRVFQERGNAMQQLHLWRQC